MLFLVLVVKHVIHLHIIVIYIKENVKLQKIIQPTKKP